MNQKHADEAKALHQARMQVCERDTEISDLRAQLADAQAQLAAEKEALDLALPIVEADFAEWGGHCTEHALNKIREVLNNHSEKSTRQQAQDKVE